MNNEEASHYQSGTFIGIKAHAGLGERCGKTKENDFLDRIFGNVFCEQKVYTRSHIENGEYHRQLKEELGRKSESDLM